MGKRGKAPSIHHGVINDGAETAHGSWLVTDLYEVVTEFGQKEFPESAKYECAKSQQGNPSTYRSEDPSVGG